MSFAWWVVLVTWGLWVAGAVVLGVGLGRTAAKRSPKAPPLGPLRVRGRW